ncbi:hypothetical protein RFI_29535 [Reticulomyxa filosa]|uniref:Uncharacterized protein n=1 Tax=Reticulomyxa filosa TaxID=46433 RepID=X6M4A2_RETFI|nr:hypothetical protein RFI_29535 [Reticulomyxa filosa]|eukprot:ETO07855.1 hypothetical protein RFI_29535 [Reticulomyxa filosa]
MIPSSSLEKKIEKKKASEKKVQLVEKKKATVEKGTKGGNNDQNANKCLATAVISTVSAFIIVWSLFINLKYGYYLNNYEIHSKRVFYCFFGFENKKNKFFCFIFYLFVYACDDVQIDRTEMPKINLNIHEIIVMKKNGQDIVQIIGKKMARHCPND